MDRTITSRRNWWVAFILTMILSLLPLNTIAAQDFTPPLSFDALENGRYTLPGIGLVSLDNGAFSNSDFAIEFETSYIGGDLNFDGVRGDAAVILTASTTEAEPHFYLLALANDAGTPEQLGVTYLGRGLQIDTLLINGADVNLSYAETGSLRTSDDAILSLDQFRLPETETALSPLPQVPINQFIVFDLSFDPNTNTAIVDGFMPRAGEHRYQFDGSTGERVAFDLYMRDDFSIAMSFVVIDLTTNTLLASGSSQSPGTVTLPRTGRYEVAVGGSSQTSARYTLVVERESAQPAEGSPVIAASPALPTSQILIDPDTGSGEVTGNISSQGVVTYLVPASAGNVLDLRLDIAGDITVGTAGEPVLEITDTDTGDVLLRSSERRQFASVTVDSASILAINVVAARDSASYTLQLTVETSTAPLPPTPPSRAAPTQPQLPQLDGAPQRIDFGGSSNTSLQQRLDAGGVDVYAFSGQQGQSLSIQSQGDVVLGIVGLNDITLLSPNSGVSSYTVTLPASGEYTISVRGRTQVAVEYTIIVSLMGVNTYVVQPNDTLLEIAVRFGTTIDILLALNNLSDPNLLFAGQVLQLP